LDSVPKPPDVEKKQEKKNWGWGARSTKKKKTGNSRGKERRQMEKIVRQYQKNGKTRLNQIQKWGLEKSPDLSE